MTPDSDTLFLDDLHARYSIFIEQSIRDLKEFSSLHPDFLADCIGAISRKSNQHQCPMYGALYPDLVANGLTLDETEYRLLRAAWIALYGYASLIDIESDKAGTVAATTSLSASALLGWGIATISRLTASSPLFEFVVSNIMDAFAAQRQDIKYRSESHYERTESDRNKNSAFVAIVAALCAAGREGDGSLIRATRLLLGAFQLVDDISDLREDIEENNLTDCVKMAVGYSQVARISSAEMSLYRVLFLNKRLPTLLARAEADIGLALLEIDGHRHQILFWYISMLLKQVAAFRRDVERFQSGDRAISEPDLYEQVRKIICGT